ncbi:hypothetical protein [Paraherbaspirillum soli]|uniref:Glycosyltransferase RgtA/B/C/D-like domain-containing protein n=1 Tax=Paraherbaspirillum soli TaxID=631222 RepID=A0ABW0MB75_9BURK
MSMIAHGYGLASYGTPQLVFSNVLWGYIVRAIPTINNILGYSLATISVLLVVGWLMLYFLRRLGAGYFVGVLAIVLLLARPVIVPQFTVNAGLLAVVAVIALQAYARFQGRGMLAAVCVLAFCSYLIRSNEFVLVICVALPLLPWHMVRKDRQTQIALVLLVLAIAAAAAVDYWAYSGPEWQAFKDLNQARIAFTDYGVGEYLIRRPEILAKYGFSRNDVNLLTNWFFADPKVANPEALKAMLGELGPLAIQANAIASAWAAVKTFWSPMLWPLSLAALALAMIRPSWRVLVAWLLCISAVIALGLMGRPGIMRVYVPLVTLLIVAPFLIGNASPGRNAMASAVLLTACILNFHQFAPEEKRLRSLGEVVRHDLSGFPSEPVVMWAGVFPLELSYPVLMAPHSFRFYALSTFTLAPFSVSRSEGYVERGLIKRLRGESGVPIVASEMAFGLLQNYCAEHYGGQLREQALQQYGMVAVSWRRCEVGQ